MPGAARAAKSAPSQATDVGGEVRRSS
jgi:hypothetical protein